MLNPQPVQVILHTETPQIHPPPPPPSPSEVIVMEVPEKEEEEAHDQTSRSPELLPRPPAAASQNHSPSPSPSLSPCDLEVIVMEVHEEKEDMANYQISRPKGQAPRLPAAAAAATQNHLPPPPPVAALHPEWFSLFMNFCLAGLSISFQSNQASSGSSSHLPIGSQMAALGTVLALAAFLVSKYIPENLGPLSRKLEIAGVFCGVTGFILDITPSVYPSLQIIFWSIYGFSLLAIIISRNFNIFRD